MTDNTDNRRTPQLGATEMSKKLADVVAEIAALIAELEQKRAEEFAALGVGSDPDNYHRLLSKILRWHRIAAAVRCGRRPPKPIEDVSTQREKNLYARALGIVKSMQKIGQ